MQVGFKRLLQSGLLYRNTGNELKQLNPSSSAQAVVGDDGDASSRSRG